MGSRLYWVVAEEAEAVYEQLGAPAVDEGEEEEQEEGDGVRKELWTVCEMASVSEGGVCCLSLLVALAALELGDSLWVGVGFLGLVELGLAVLASVLVAVVMSLIWSLMVSGWLWQINCSWDWEA